jgi:hypothetical protein
VKEWLPTLCGREKNGQKEPIALITAYGNDAKEAFE